MNTLIQKLRQYGLLRFVQFAWSELILRPYYQCIKGSYSQYQDDCIIDALVKHKKIGFYVDVGAFDPIKFNNTYRFYKNGWNGITIEPNTEKWKKLSAVRPQDIHVNIGVGRKKGVLKYYQMNPGTLSTFSKHQAVSYQKQGFSLEKILDVPVHPLAAILEKYAKGKRIDIMSVDVEGFEMEVLASNNWKKYRPYCICVEVETPSEKGQAIHHPIYRYLKLNGYTWIQNNHTNAFFIDSYARP